MTTLSACSLRQIAFMLIVLFALTACNNSRQKNNQQSEKVTKNILKGSHWTSDFFCYHNNYYFITDSTGFSQDGQFLWSTPIDPVLYNNSRDSIGYGEDTFFKYLLKDTVLKINYLSASHDTLIDQRIFYLQKGNSNKIIFKSDYEYTYGHEWLKFKKKIGK